MTLGRDHRDVNVSLLPVWGWVGSVLEVVELRCKSQCVAGTERGRAAGTVTAQGALWAVLQWTAF